jgi:hypothetical protein
LWGSSDRQGASSVVHLFSSSHGRMWRSKPIHDFQSANNNAGLTLGGAAAATCRRHSLEVEDEGHFNVFV